MKYQNKDTGATIDVKSEISGGGWQAVKPAAPSNTKVAPAQPPKRKVKKDG